MAYGTIRYSVEDGVAEITLARPASANAMDAAMMEELLDAAIRCDEDPSVRAVLLTGEGRAFCAGGDLASFSRLGDALPAALKRMTTHLHGAISRFARMDAPLVSAVNGVAAGAGMSLACAADLSLAAASARFTMAYTRAGLTPDGSATFFLSRLVGLRRAQELMLTNRMLSAPEAAEWGLVNRVVTDETLLDEARSLARSLAEGPTRAFGQVKRLLLLGEGNALEAQMEHEARAIADAARGADGREGIAAFLEKRPPRFGGA
jgi:2-(1,2-epoxy-1,2-dihydrophenyl)acetyl-CoA isomerase